MTETIQEKIARMSAKKQNTTKVEAPSIKTKLMPTTGLATNEAPTEEAPSLSPILAVNDEMRQLEGFNPDMFVTKLNKSKECLEAKAPSIANYLKDINKDLSQYPELVHLINDTQIAIITRGFLFLTDTNMAELTTRRGSKKIADVDECAVLF